MLVDPNQVAAFAAPTASVTALPSVAPVIPHTFEKASGTGQRALWVVFIIMLVATVIFSVVSFSLPIAKRLYHVITTLIVCFAALSYFAMAAGDGISYHKNVIIEDNDVTGVPTKTIVFRQVYWARYVDWTVTTPLLLLDLALLAGLSGGNIIIAIVADVIMIVTGLFAAFGSNDTTKWGWYAIACIAYLAVVWQLAVNGRATAFGKSGKVGNFFAAIAGFTFILWTVYPIVWGVADGARIASVDAEIIAYAILDVLAKPIFGAWLLYTHATLPETNIELGGFWTHGVTGEGGVRLGDDDEGA